MAGRYIDKTTAQILLRWDLQHEFFIIPKSFQQRRILENSQLYDFELTEQDMETLDFWGDPITKPEDRNVYKQDWNWNPIDEAPVHKGATHYWPHFEGVDQVFFAEDEEEEFVDDQYGDEEEDDDEEEEDEEL